VRLRLRWLRLRLRWRRPLIVWISEWVLIQFREGILSMTTPIQRWRSLAGSFQINSRSKSFDPAEPGLFHYLIDDGGERKRVHLRIDPDRAGILIINANQMLHLNPTAAIMARLALEKSTQSEAIRAVTRQFRISRSQALQDYTQFSDQFNELIRPDGACPIHDLGLEIQPPFSTKPSAPYRMDLALTYRCNNDCAHCYNARSRQFPEMDTADWKRVLDRLWQIGIPHIVFTGGEPTLRDDLPELIAYAEQTGQITGLNTNGRRISDKRYLNDLIEAGLDHIQITFESHDPNIHDAMVSTKGAWRQTIAGIQNTLESPLYVMTNTTMLTENSPFLRETLTYLAELGVPTVGLNALIYSGRGQKVGTGLPEKELEPLLMIAREITDQHNQRLIWYTPTEYCQFDPMQLELGVKGCTAALYNMCLEPDGSVLPCQSYYQPLGNILNDSWGTIWNHPLPTSLRNRSYVEEKCNGCPFFTECGGGCPLRNLESNQLIMEKHLL
jgi:radical SAM protein with 4Fe4S-binding SPASM domain